MSAKHSTILALMLFLGLATSAQAGILVDTLDGQGADTGESLTSSEVFGQSFVADSTGIGDVELELSNSNSASTGSVVITIYTDNGGKLGTKLDTIASVPASEIPSAETLFDFDDLSFSNLSSGSTYFIRVAPSSSTSTSDVFETLAPATDGTGTLFAVGSTTGVTSPHLALCVSDDNSCDADFPANIEFFSQSTPTPEPASVAILGAGLAGLGYVRRRGIQRAKV